jgi:hypothetical protein
MSDRPDWWSWEIELSDHLVLRMAQRDFNEADLRTMLEDANSVTPDAIPGRWFISTTFRGSPWAVILEPDLAERIIVAITAFEIS